MLEAGPDGPRRVGAWPGRARPRDASSYPGGFVAFERGSRAIYRWEGGSLRELGRVDAAEVFLTSSRALARGAVHEKGKGFSFELYDVGGSLERRAGLSLDCFPSDCVFAAGRWYLAGADGADAANRLYEIDPRTGRARILAELPKERDFGRLIAGGGRLWYYLSPALPRPGSAAVLSFALSETDGVRSGPERVVPRGLPEGSCPYGSGFALAGRFWLPVASGEGPKTEIAAVALDPSEKEPRAPRSMPLATGIYAPIGESGGRFYAFGFLYVKDRSATSLLSIGADGARSWPLP